MTSNTPEIRAMRREYLRISEAAHEYGLSRSMIYKQIKLGRLKLLKVGRRSLLGRQDMETLVTGQ